jgi:hypothetical protein
MATNATNLVVGPVRLTYVYALKPSENGKLGATILVPKADKAMIARINAAIEAANKLGASKNGKDWPARPKSTWYDGDDYQPSGKAWPPECKGHMVLRTTANQQPGIVDRRCQPIIDTTQVYSGMWANCDINFYPYNNSSVGISCGLNNLQKVRDDEAFGGRARAQDVFKAMDDDDDLGL